MNIIDNKWNCYIIKHDKSNATYVGVTPTPDKRIRQHNGEICGGAKYTTKQGAYWEYVCIIQGFSKIQSMQFEWALKHVPPRSHGGIANRIKKLEVLINKQNWTSKSILSTEVELTINWLQPEYRPDIFNIPAHIKELY